MKLSVVLLTVACLGAAAAGRSQNISFSGREVPLEKVFSAIKQQTGYVVFFEYTLLREARPVTLDVKNEPLATFLDRLFVDQPLSYTIEGKTILITQRAIPVPAASTTPLPPNSIHGRVTDSLGKPLAGASVAVVGSKRGTETDVNGMFEVKGVSDGAVLRVSFTGYLPREVRVHGQDLLTISLSRSTNPLDEVQVIAYGQSTQRLNVGNVTVVNSAQIERQPVSNPLLALEGLVPGVFITQGTGFANSGVTTLIQGQNSIGNGNDPFIVIDGVPYTSQMLPSLNNNTGTSGVNFRSPGNALSYINPGDIESISVLKDADATAIYGSRAANGAILITTKKGKDGQTQININAQQGFGQVAHKMKMLNTSQYLAMRHEAIMNDGLTVPPTAYDINGFWDTTRNIDWQKELIGGKAQYTNVYASASGGTAHLQYLIGTTYHRETTVYPTTAGDQKASVNFSLTNSSANEKFHLQFTGNYQYDDNRMPNLDFTTNAIFLPPDAPPLYNADGSINWATNGGVSTWSNPIANLKYLYSSKTTNLISNLQLSYQLLPGLDARVSVGYTSLKPTELLTIPLSIVPPENLALSTGAGQYSYNSITSWIAEPQVSYRSTIWKGKLEALAGTSIQQSNSSGITLLGLGFTNDAVIPDIHSATNVIVSNSTSTLYRYNGLFGRVNYTFDDRFILDLNVRRDGSSRFGSANQFHNFGSIAGGWIFSNESWIRDQLKALSFGKLKASYGTTGNDQIGDYQFLSQYYPFTADVPYQNASSVTPGGLSNPYLQWEETRKLNLGAEMGLFKDRIYLNADYYRNRSSNQLLFHQLPNFVGFSGIAENFPATVQNSGWEISLRGTIIKRSDLTWSSTLNITVPSNKLIRYDNLATSGDANRLIIGKPINITKVFHFDGVNPQTGVYQFLDSKGNVTSNPDYLTDNTVLINLAPAWYGGWQNDVSYKAFSLGFLFQYVRQKGQNYNYGASGLAGFWFNNQPTSVLDRWQKPGDHASHQRFSSNFDYGVPASDAVGSDAAYTDASFIRLRNIALSYQLPGRCVKAIHIKNAAIYIQGQNVLTLTHFVGMDPESKSIFTLPPLRVLTAGIKVGL